MTSYYNLFIFKKDNILLARPGDLNSLKIADFGLGAKYAISKIEGMDAHCGTLIYMAPEVINSKEYTKKVDIFSSGIIMYMLLTGGQHPILKPNDTGLMYK